ncbi:conserved hypothetical protein [Mesorhizobium sp. ORS 3359]|nr:conserved hypothetical protein [Mesorhizobium sp. ORS 3359]
MSLMKQAMKTILLPIIRPLWQRAWSHVEGRVEPIEARLVSLEARAAQIEQAWQTHIPSLLSATAHASAVSNEIAGICRQLDKLAESHSQNSSAVAQWNATTATLSQRTETLEERGNNADAAIRSLQEHGNNAEAAIGSLWERVEFVRREILFEFNHGAGKKSTPNGTETQKIEPRIISAAKFEAARDEKRLRLNLGCGHIALADYINVDARDLPGVDVVADVGNLPVEENSVDEIFSAHLIEHFPLETLRRRLLPYWCSKLRPGGTFKAVTPDAAAMVQATAAGTMSFEDFREVTYGAQDYDGDYHFSLFTPGSLQELLQEMGFKEISVPVAARRNGKCFEFEIVAIAP